MKTFMIWSTSRGLQFHTLVSCKTKKKACEILDCNYNELTNYGYIYETTDEILLDNSEKRFIKFDNNSKTHEMMIPKDKIGIIIPYEEGINYINSYADEKYKKWKESIGIKE
jgi:hypothetical protein